MAKTRPHHWIWHWIGRQLCAHCGLLWLRNELSDRWARKPCPGKDAD